MKVAAGCFISPSLRGAQRTTSLRGAECTPSLRGVLSTSLRGAKRRGNLFLPPRHCRLDRQSVLATCLTGKIPRLVALTWNDSETTGKDSGTAVPVAALSSISSVDPQTLADHRQSTNQPKSCLMVSFSASVHAFSPPSVNKTAQNLPVGPEFSICQRGNGRSTVKLL